MQNYREKLHIKYCTARYLMQMQKYSYSLVKLIVALRLVFSLLGQFGYC